MFRWVFKNTGYIIFKSRVLPDPYLQVRHAFLKGLQVVSQGSLLLQELGVAALSGRLEEAVVVNVPQRLGEGADDLLLGAPHRAVQVQLEAPLTDTQQSSQGIRLNRQ